MLSFCHVNHDLCSLSNTYHISDFVHQLCWRLMGRTFCDLPADLQPGAKHDAKYDQLGNILFQKKVRCLVLGHSMSLCVALCYSDPCFPHVSLMFASWVYRVCCQNQPNHSCCGTPASAASLMEDSISSAHVMTVIPLLSTFHSCSSCGS